MRSAFALCWFMLIGGGFTAYCYGWANGRINWGDPFRLGWIPLTLLFVVPALGAKWRSTPHLIAGNAPPNDETGGRERPPTSNVPIWGWMFVFACTTVTLLATVGLMTGREEQRIDNAISGAVGLATATACLLVGRGTKYSLGLRLGLCLFAGLFSWGVFFALVLSHNILRM